MKVCINDISVPFIIMSPHIQEIIKQYKNNDYIMKFTQKSNYDVIAKLTHLLSHHILSYFP